MDVSRPAAAVAEAAKPASETHFVPSVQPCQPAADLSCPPTPPALTSQIAWQHSEDYEIFGTQLSPLLQLPSCPDQAAIPAAHQQTLADHEQEQDQDGASALGSDSEDGQCLTEEDAEVEQEHAGSKLVRADSDEVARLSWALLDKGGYLQMPIQVLAACAPLAATFTWRHGEPLPLPCWSMLLSGNRPCCHTICNVKCNVEG